METVIQEKQDYALELRDPQGNWHLRYFTPSQVALMRKNTRFNQYCRIPEIKTPEPVGINESVSRTAKPVKPTPENT